MVYKTYIFINTNLSSYITWNRTKKSQTELLYYCFGKGTIFVKKMLILCKKNTGISKIKGILVLKGLFSKTTYACVLSYQISSF